MYGERAIISFTEHAHGLARSPCACAGAPNCLLLVATHPWGIFGELNSCGDKVFA